MPHTRHSSHEIVRLGEELYQRSIRAQVETDHKGKFLVLDVETGEYEIDADSLAALDRAKAKHDDPALYLLRIGHRAAVKLGGGVRPASA